LLSAYLFDAPVVNLSRKQSQWQADRTARMRKHTLDREVSLAGVGGAENCGDAAMTAGRRTLACGKDQ